MLVNLDSQSRLLKWTNGYINIVSIGQQDSMRCKPILIADEKLINSWLVAVFAYFKVTSLMAIKVNI